MNAAGHFTVSVAFHRGHVHVPHFLTSGDKEQRTGKY